MDITVGAKVTFSQGNDAGTMLEGTVSRVWPGGRTVTIKTTGAIAGSTRTYVRDLAAVQVQA